MEKLHTLCKPLDMLTNGGLPTGTITQVFGEKALGKSILCFQAACATVAEGRTAIVLDADKAVSKGGRVELQLKSTPVYLSALHRLVDQTKAKLLIYDSLSAPLKSTFPSTQDLPARSSSLAMLLSHAQRLCIEFGISVL